MAASFSSPIVVAGAGIGGLSLAVSLQRRGFPVRVWERATAIAPIGAGILIQPNAMSVMKRLGLADAVVAAGNPVSRTALLDRRGKLLGAEQDVAALSADLGAPAVAIHRARLHALLEGRLEPGTLELGKEVTGYEARGGSVEVQCAGGSATETPLLVGADGLRSSVRRQMIGNAEPVYSGYTSWRGVTAPGKGPRLHRVSETWGRGERFGMAEIGHGEIYWFAVANAPPGGKDTSVQAELIARFGGWHEPIRSVLEATPPDRILRTDISDRDPIARWHEGNVVLLGDAAHPMTPNLGQGACQAIEDAFALASALAAAATTAEAIRQYEQRRASRANAIVLAARRLGAVAQWSNPLAAGLRNGLMRMIPARVTGNQMRSLWTSPE